MDDLEPHLTLRTFGQDTTACIKGFMYDDDVSHLAPSYSNMHRVVGPLSTGTYIPIGILNNQDHIPKVQKSGSGYAVSSTKDKNDENVEVRTISTPTCIFHL